MVSPTLRERFLTAPVTFRSAIDDSQVALEAFQTKWDLLGLDLQRELNASNLQLEDLLAAQNASLRIKTLSSALSDLHQATSSATSSFVSELGDLLSSISITDHDHTPKPSLSLSTPPYMKHAFSWLLGNLHDPYPTSGVKKDICQLDGCAGRVLTEWFKSMRRCIGWTDVCKEHFSGSRARTRDAAYAIFVSQETEGLAQPVIADFLAVQSNLYSLFVDVNRLTYTQLATNRDNSPSSPASPDWPNGPYPRPHSSLSQHSSTPSLLYSTSDDSEEDDPIPGFPFDLNMCPRIPASVNARKPPSETHESAPLPSWNYDFVASSGVTIPFDSPVLSTETAIWDIPDPLSSSLVSSRPSSPLRFSGSDSSNISATSQNSVSYTTKRKRRLSDVGVDTKRKRPLISLPARAVSDPLPSKDVATTLDVEDIISEWFKEDYSSMFNIPAAITTEPSSSEIGWDNLDIMQPFNAHDCLETCEQWSSLVSCSPHISSLAPPADVTSQPFSEDLWVPLLHVQEPAREPEAVTAGPITHSPPSVTLVEFSSPISYPPCWGDDVSSLENFADLVQFPSEMSPSIL